MLDICRLRNPIKNYDWGSRTALAELLGRPSPAPRPEAELWMGAHAMASSEVRLGDGWVSLRELIETRSEDLVGRRDAPELPFLFKVLAVERPLSIQAHPDHRQAIDGCRREDQEGIPRHGERRRYRDEQPKTELLYALGSFSMLRGFRPVPEIVGLIDRLDLARLLPEIASAGEESLGRIFRLWMDLDPRRLGEIFAALEARETDDEDELYWLRRLHAVHPGDRGVLAPIFLHLIRLENGQATYTEPRVLHAYLEGVGVELMTNSDNVVRGGLTSKPRDVEELDRILRFEPDPPRLLEPLPEAPGIQSYTIPDTGLTLAVIGLPGAGGLESHAAGGVEILLSIDASGRLVPSAGEPHELRRGDSFLVPASAGTYRLEGTGRVVRADASRPGAAAANHGP